MCDCPPKHLNCLTAKEWMKRQIGVWRFAYEARDVRDKTIHPATFPIALAKAVIELFTHRGELVLDPFVGSGTTLVAAQDLERNAVGYDLQPGYVASAQERLAAAAESRDGARQLALVADARAIRQQLRTESVASSSSPHPPTPTCSIAGGRTRADAVTSARTTNT